MWMTNPWEPLSTGPTAVATEQTELDDESGGSPPEQPLPERTSGIKRIAIVGVGEVAQKLAKEMRDKERDRYCVVGFIDDDAELARRHNVELLGGCTEIRRIIEDLQIDELVVAYHGKCFEQILHEAHVLKGRTRVRLVPSLFESMTCKLSFDRLLDVPLVPLVESDDGAYARLGKRCLDVAASLLLLIPAAPVIALVALAVALTSPGPVFYVQERVGLGGRRFSLVKFRTMVANAESLTGPTLCTENDPRITRIGALLRAFRLDELPQLINVLKGEMSLVGPRPERPVFVEQFIQAVPWYSERHRTRPGITGLAQVQGRYQTDVYTKLRHDLMYTSHMSLLLDLRIMLRTIGVMLEHRP